MESEGSTTEAVALRWTGDTLELLDQRLLPDEETWIRCSNADEVADAIREMVVRGAPAIGIAAAWGVVLAAQADPSDAGLDRAAETLAAARPTAVNLAWALARMRRVAGDAGGDRLARLGREAAAIQAEDLAMNLAMAEHGAALIPEDSVVFTHCNTGALATAGHGTALGVIRTAHAAGRVRLVVATETRPWLQGARLTAWELARDRIPVRLITEGAAASEMRRLSPSWLIVGADRITALGDVANKIGTYTLALVARAQGARVMVVAPSSTLDMDTAEGADIPIEERDPAEVWRAAARGVLPQGLEIGNPAFDVTPRALIDAIVTERGVARAPYGTSLRGMMTEGAEEGR